MEFPPIPDNNQDRTNSTFYEFSSKPFNTRLSDVEIFSQTRFVERDDDADFSWKMLSSIWKQYWKSICFFFFCFFLFSGYKQFSRVHVRNYECVDELHQWEQLRIMDFSCQRYAYLSIFICYIINNKDIYQIFYKHACGQTLIFTYV